jgi:putative flippase GtrA
MQLPSSYFSIWAMRNFSKPILYGAFAALCTAFNLGAQRLVNLVVTPRMFPGDMIVYLGMLAGTTVGLVTKFFLDKFFVFRHRARSASSNIGKFALYALFGAATTGIFWGVELVFYYLWSEDISKYIGGFFGLVLGYTTKYFLDKTFVFSAPRDGKPV